jgi:hypothetical protein
MDRKTQQILAVVVIIIVIIAGLAIVLLNNEPETSDARAMILNVNEVQVSAGGNWVQVSIKDIEPKYTQTSKSEAYSEMSNESLGMFAIIVYVFGNDSACNARLLDTISGMTFNSCVPQLGNESYTTWTGIANYVYLTFRDRNVLVWFSIGMHDVIGADWLNEFAISQAQLQLDKIDQYLAQHPGAS